MSIQDANDRAAERYRKAIVIEVTSDGTIHVTLDGLFYVNNTDAFVRAVSRIYEHHPELKG
jgi:hypothetical protein